MASISSSSRKSNTMPSWRNWKRAKKCIIDTLDQRLLQILHEVSDRESQLVLDILWSDPT